MGYEICGWLEILHRYLSFCVSREYRYCKKKFVCRTEFSPNFAFILVYLVERS